MGRRKGLEGGRDGEVEAMGRWKQWGKEAMMGGGRGGEEGIGRKRRDGSRVDERRVDGIWEDVMVGRRDRDDGKMGFAWCPR